MPTLIGPGAAGVSQARVELDYGVNYNADRTDAYFHMNWVLYTRYSTQDSVNQWSISGDLGSASGANVPYNHGSNGGRSAFRYQAGWFRGYPTVSGRVDTLEAGGGSVWATFRLDPGPLAPYTGGAYIAYNVGVINFTVGNIVDANGNHGAIVDTQIEVNYRPDGNGSWYYQTGRFSDPVATGLTGGTDYWYRLRIANNTYGWGPWGPWKVVRTLPGCYVSEGGVPKNATPFVKELGVWRPATRFINETGAWRQ